MYTPEEWVLVKVNNESPHYRVFGSWRGGYISGDSWRMNSGVTSVEKDEEYFIFHGASSSIYKCHEKCYGISSLYNGSVLSDYKDTLGDNFIVLTDMPDILSMDWLIN